MLSTCRSHYRRTDAAAAATDRNLPSDRSRAVHHGMGRDELFLLWEDTVKEGELRVPNTSSALEGALTIRCDFADPLFVRGKRCDGKFLCGNPRSAVVLRAG